MKSKFREKSGTSHWEISVSCTTQECDNVTALYYPISVLLSFKWSLTRGSKYSYLTKKILVFWKTGCNGEVVATGGLTVYAFYIILFLCLKNIFYKKKLNK